MSKKILVIKKDAPRQLNAHHDAPQRKERVAKPTQIKASRILLVKQCEVDLKKKQRKERVAHSAPSRAQILERRAESSAMLQFETEVHRVMNAKHLTDAERQALLGALLQGASNAQKQKAQGLRTELSNERSVSTLRTNWSFNPSRLIAKGHFDYYRK